MTLMRNKKCECIIRAANGSVLDKSSENKAATHSLMYRESPSNAMDGRRKDKRSNSEGLIKLNMKKKITNYNEGW